MTKPTDARTPPRRYRYHESPDIRLRPAQGSPLPAKPGDLPWARGSFGSIYTLWAFQVAMHAVDPLVRPISSWRPQLDSRIIAYKRNHLPAEAPDALLTEALWDHVVTAANAWKEPWDGTEPTEADLYELILNETAYTARHDVVKTDNRECKMDVLVHHRHFQPVPSAEVQVMLLRRAIEPAEGNGGGVALSNAWKTAVVQRFGGATPALPDNWQMVGLANPTSPVSARMPRAVTFDVDFRPAIFVVNSNWLFLAVVSSTMDVVSDLGLAGATVEDLVRGSHHVAARFIRVEF